MRSGCSLVILAGGLSRRMGRDKATLPAGDGTLVGLVRALAGDFEAVVPRPDLEPEGVCALYIRELAPRIEELLDAGERSIKSLLDRSFVRYVGSDELRAVDPELRSFRNINTAADYENWLRIQPDLR